MWTRGRALAFVFFTLILGLVCFLEPAEAQVLWTASSGDWALGSNWSNTTGPGNGDIAVVANGGTATIGLSGPGTFPVSGNYNQILTGSGNLTGNIAQLDGTTVNTGYLSGPERTLNALPHDGKEEFLPS